MPSVTVSHTATASAFPQGIWDSLQRAETWLGLGVMDTVSNEQSHDGRLVGFDWTAAVGGNRHGGTARVVESRPGESLKLGLRSSEIEGDLEVLLGPLADGATVEVTLTARSRGFLAGMFWGRIAQSIERGLPAKVEEFAARF